MKRYIQIQFKKDIKNTLKERMMKLKELEFAGSEREDLVSTESL